MKALFVDDHAAIRRGLETILRDAFPNLEATGVGDAPAAIELIRREPWDFIVMDVNLPGRNGIDVTKDILALRADARILIVSIHPEREFALRAVRAGASGYLSKDSEPDELVFAARAILAGRKYITPALAEQLAESFSRPPGTDPHETLSDREQEVFLLLAAGQSVKQIADQLGLSAKTVYVHREHILTKMNAAAEVELTLYAVRHGLLT
jgi:two-component system, NarL family, invasion response regulator UvrY